VALETASINPDRVVTTRTKVETYHTNPRVNIVDRAFLIAQLLLGRKRTGTIRFHVCQGTVCDVQWEEKE
jgi:hypothetical protein